MLRRSSPQEIVTEGAPPSILDAALAYHRRKLPITLCDDKKPLGRGWNETENGAEWQLHSWTVPEIRRAFDVRPTLNIGVALGPRSKLVDFEADNPAEERAFAELFEGCDIPVTPTFKSRRGKHRLFRWDRDLEETGKGIVKFRGLGIRIGAGGKGAQSLLPPSINTDGTVRQWLVSLDECDPAPIPKAVVQRIIEASRGRVDTEDTEDTSHDLSPTVSSEATVSSVSTDRIDAAIAATMPTGEGKRNDTIFVYVRWLKSFPDLAALPLKELKPLVRRWHAAALPIIGTKPFETTWLDFARAWKSARFAMGEGPVDDAFKAAVAAAAVSMPVAALEYEQSKLRLLVCLCRELQRLNGRKSFFLAVRTAARLLDVSHTQAAEWLETLRLDEVVKIDKVGDHSKRLATSYFYLGDLA